METANTVPDSRTERAIQAVGNAQAALADAVMHGHWQSAATTAEKLADYFKGLRDEEVAFSQLQPIPMTPPPACEKPPQTKAAPR